MENGSNLPDLIAWSSAIGSFLPLVISFLKGASWSDRAKRNFAMVISIVASVVTTAAVEGWSFGDPQTFFGQLVISFGNIQALAQTTYQGFWKDTALETSLENVGAK